MLRRTTKETRMLKNLTSAAYYSVAVLYTASLLTVFSTMTSQIL